MKFLKPKFWENKNNIFVILLMPFSLVSKMISFLNRKITTKNRFDIPIICVGNIYLGGTGKTPLSILIENELKKRKKKPVIIKKYYHDQSDEYELIKNLNNNLIVSKNRKYGVEEAISKKFDIVILDDGFQDSSLKKDVNIICFNNKQKIGNGLVIPAGPLRESLGSLERVEIVVINGRKDEKFEAKILSISNNLKIFYSKYVPSNINEFKEKKLAAFAGIGNPSNFFDLLKENNLNVEKTFSFPDHYNFKKKEIQKMIDFSKNNNLELITTEKDYHRIKKFEIENIKYLKIDLIINNKDNFINQVLKFL